MRLTCFTKRLILACVTKCGVSRAGAGSDTAIARNLRDLCRKRRLSAAPACCVESAEARPPA